MIVRAIVVLVGIGFIVFGFSLLRQGSDAWPGTVSLCVVGAMFVVGTVFEARRYRPAPNGAGTFEKTSERFVDPTTGKLTEVRYDPKTGERQYVEPSQ